MNVGTKLRAWKASPALFVREVLNAIPDAWQEDVLNAAPDVSRIALKASKGPGKSTVLAWLAWWFLATRPHPKVIATSITSDNLRDGLWAELSKWQQKSKLLARSFSWSAERVTSKQFPETWWASARQWSRSADTYQQGQTLAGLHADHVLVLVDEAGGIPDAVVATAEAALANAEKESGREAKLVLAGNPTHLEGPLYRACTRERPLWYVYEVSGDPDDPKRAPRVSAEWARQQISKYGRDSSYVAVNVFGQFPPASSTTLLGVDEVVKSSQLVLSQDEYLSEPIILGVDVARYGDDRSCIIARQGKAAFRPEIFRELDLMSLVGQVTNAIASYAADACFVDQTGIGAGVVDRLHQLGYPVIGIDFGTRASRGKYANKRCEMWWLMAEWVKAGGRIPPNDELISELVSPHYKFDASNRLVLETKAEMKARGVESPDIADALALTFAARVGGKKIGDEKRMLTASRMQYEYDPFLQVH